MCGRERVREVRGKVSDFDAVRVTNSGKEVARLNSGDFFGEVRDVV